MRSRRVPGRDLELMRQAEEHLAARLRKFFTAVAKHVAGQLSKQLEREMKTPADVDKFLQTAWDPYKLPLGKIGSPAPLLDPTVSPVDGSDWHVRPEDAQPIYGIPVADVVTRANVQHVSWELVRKGKTQTESITLPLKKLIATQEVVDRRRLLTHEQRMSKTGKPELAPLAIFWDGDFFLLDGHHRMQAAYNLRVSEVVLDVMLSPEQ